jgi:acylphosphatase
MTRRYVVRGVVQGVGFRWFARRMAEAFDVTGWARNAADGSVEIVAHGTPENLRSFKEQIEIGPSSARVDRVSDEDHPEERFARFDVVS